MIDKLRFGEPQSSVAILDAVIEVRIRIIREGEPKDAHLRALQSDYVTRIEHFVSIRIEENVAIEPAKSSKASTPGRNRLTSAGQRLLERLEGSYTILLDPGGREWTSKEFARWLGERALSGTRELVFVVGGDRGVAAPIRERADLLFGLSRMTLTHDWACTLLLEQIYRGFTILRGYPYAR
jgi:23S rRNA (pseudouridine1915-N3)-methyltransferase